MEAPRELWLRYKKNPSVKLRDRILEYYQDVLKAAAHHFMVVLPPEAFVEFDYLVNVGWMEMVKAMDRYNPDLGVTFTTYSDRRVKGSVLDELRNMDWVPRLTRGYTAKLEKIKENCLQQHCRLPTDEEVRRKAGLTKKEYKRNATYHQEVTNVSLNRKWFETDSGRYVFEIDILKDRNASDPAENIMKRNVKEWLQSGFNRSEKLVLILYYYEDMTMKEIGNTLDLSESRVSQMHTSILARIKSRLLGLPKHLKIDDFCFRR